MHQGFNEFVHFEWPDITKAGDWHYNGQYFAYIFSGAAIFIPLSAIYLTLQTALILISWVQLACSRSHHWQLTARAAGAEQYSVQVPAERRTSKEHAEE